MPYILGFGGQKGGSGKTILATSTAVQALADGASVIVYDLDETQQSAGLWAQRRNDNGIEPKIDIKSLSRSEIPQALNGEDVAILDMPGFADNLTADVAKHCHLFVLPTGTGYQDLDTTIMVAHALVKKGIIKDRLYFAITKAVHEGAAQKAKDYIHEAGYKTLKGFSRFAPSIENAQNKGLGLTEIPYERLREESRELIENIALELVRERDIRKKQSKDYEIFIEPSGTERERT